MLARKVTHKVRVCMAARMIMPTSGPLRVHVGAIWLWPGCLLGVWVANLPWMPVASSRVSQMPPVIAVNFSLHTDANPINTLTQTVMIVGINLGSL